MKIVIGVLGEEGSGKDTFSHLLSPLIVPHTLLQVKTSGFLNETLQMWKLPNTRYNLQHLAIAMRSQFGETVLPNAIKKKISEASEDVVVLDAVRWEADRDLVRSFPINFLVYITASPEVRFERLRHRHEKAGESDIIFEDFQKQEQVATETTIKTLAAEADFTIENNGSMEDFEKQVKEFYENSLRRHW